jgi:hypothetical protein
MFFTTHMTKSQARHLASLIAQKGQYASQSVNGRLKPLTTSATSTRITCQYDASTETMEIYSNYTGENVVNEFEYLKKFQWETKSEVRES